MNHDGFYDCGMCRYVHFKYARVRFRLTSSSILSAKLAKGETLGLVILGSDKTHLTNNYGDNAGPLRLHDLWQHSEGRIETKLSSRLWVKIAQIPVGKFLEKEHNGILNQRLYHICMDIVTEMLKACSREPVPYG